MSDPTDNKHSQPIDPEGSSRHRGAQIPFGLKDGRTVTVRQVSTGLKCGCTCPACGYPLVAKARDSQYRRPHFAHVGGSDCKAGFESGLHIRAKELIVQHLRVQLPAWDGSLDGMPNPPQLLDDDGRMLFGRRVHFRARHAALASARAELTKVDYKPDVTAMDEGGELLIEILVTHAVGDLKERRVQSDGARMIEIDLRALHQSQVFDENELERQVLSEASNRRWVSCPQASEDWRESMRDLKQALLVRNAEIADARRQVAERARRQAELAVAANAERDRQLVEAREQAAVKEAKRERARTSFRARHAGSLEKLPALVELARRASLLEQYLERDAAPIASVLTEIQAEAVRRELHRHHHDAWLYQVHPTLWQASAFQRFILRKPAGVRFNNRDVAAWVRHRFGVEPVLWELFKVQYKARADAWAAGHRRKNAISAWFFTDEENRQIPNFYTPINDFLQRLVTIGVLNPVANVPGEVEICSQPGPPILDHPHLLPIASPEDASSKRIVSSVKALGESVRNFCGRIIDHGQLGRVFVIAELPGARDCYRVRVEADESIRTVLLGACA